MPQIFRACLLHVDAYVAPYTFEVNKKNRDIEYESRLWPLRILMQPAITNENETVSQFAQPHPMCYVWDPKFLRRYKIFSKNMND